MESLIARQTRFKKQILDVPSPVIRTKYNIKVPRAPVVPSAPVVPGAPVEVPSAPVIQTEIRHAELSKNKQTINESSSVIRTEIRNAEPLKSMADQNSRTESASVILTVPKTYVILLTLLFSVFVH